GHERPRRLERARTRLGTQRDGRRMADHRHGAAPARRLDSSAGNPHRSRGRTGTIDPVIPHREVLMVPVMSLLVPILVSGVIVFIGSTLIHMVLGYHKADFKALPSEDEVMTALQKFNIPPGDYMVPRPESMEAMKRAEYKAK